MNTTVVVGASQPSGQQGTAKPDASLKPAGIRSIITDNARQIVLCLAVTTIMTVAIWFLLPTLARFWVQCSSVLIEWLQLDLGVEIVAGWIPVITSAPASPLQLPNYAWHAAASIAVMLIAKLILRPPFRTLAILLATFHLLNTAVIAAFPSAYPYSIADHTRWMSMFTVGFIIALPVIMALTHAIIERNHERRVFGTLLIWAYFIVTMPAKLVAHAALIQALSRLITPTLFLVLGPAFDICLFTALYAFIVTWRHNPATV